VAVTAGYMCAEPRAEFFRHVDAANVDLKGFAGDFYRRTCLARLGPVLETLLYLRHETGVWLEITTLLISGLNDSDGEIDAMTRWVAGQLGPDVPVHFTAFHPDFKMRDRPPTPPQTLTRARRIALDNGLHYAYTGNVHDPEGQSTRRLGSSGSGGPGRITVNRFIVVPGFAWDPELWGGRFPARTGWPVHEARPAPGAASCLGGEGFIVIVVLYIGFLVGAASNRSERNLEATLGRIEQPMSCAVRVGVWPGPVSPG
jgi:hypothetical protein